MGCGVYWQQFKTVERDLASLRRLTVEESHPAYQALWKQRGALLARVGEKLPRVTIPITHEEVLGRLHALGLEYAGASPGFTAEELEKAVVKVWYDIEESWFAEARFKPGSPPIYRSLTAEEAVSFIKHEETPALIARVFTEDEYYGE